MRQQFTNREDAGRQLAERLVQLAGRKDVILLGLPPGGLVVAAEVARMLGAPLEAFVVCPMTLPGRSASVGAVASGGVRVIDQVVVGQLGVPRRLIDQESEMAQRALAREEYRYRLGRPLPSLVGKTAIVIDEGAETGTTLVSAVRALRLFGPATVIAAAPMMAAAAACRIAVAADRCVTVQILPADTTVESSYQALEPVADDVIQALLQPHHRIVQPA